MISVSALYELEYRSYGLFSTDMQKYRIGGNFRGMKFSRILRVK